MNIFTIIAYIVWLVIIATNIGGAPAVESGAFLPFFI
jgi:hypothetical protein